MLKGISPLLSPELLKTLCEMGHGDELLLADAHFPGHSLGRRVLRADGLSITPLLAAIAPLFELDRPGSPLSMMQPEDLSQLDPALEADYMGAIQQHAQDVPPPQRLSRADFYQRAASAFVVVMTGDTRPFGNILLKKGVTT